jgi:heat shock protein HslJ
MKLETVITAGFFVLLSACSTKKRVQQPEIKNVDLYSTKWGLSKIYTEEGTREVNTKAFIRFDKEKNSAGGNGSCNTFGSTTTVNGNEMSFKNIFSTKMYCEGVQSLEDLFFRQLEKANRFEIKGNTLLLYSDKALLLELSTA